MKTPSRKYFGNRPHRLPAAGASLGLLLLAWIAPTISLAQVCDILHNFGTNIMGHYPSAPLLQGPDSMLYGAALEGGYARLGQLFKVKSDGSGYAVLKDFNGDNGANPETALILSGSTLYGTTREGGANWCGTVFKLQTDGSGFQILKDFRGDDGSSRPTVVMAGSTLYGTTASGGTNGYGNVFRMGTDGSGFTVLKYFNGEDGAYPPAPLVVSGTTLYGVTREGGLHNSGTIFRINADGSEHVVLHHFAEADWSVFPYTNDDGVNPCASLVLSGAALYGTTSRGGTNGGGTVFTLNTDGGGFTVLRHFSGLDGSYPYGGLVVDGSTLYGTTVEGGGDANGTVFKLNADGSDFEVIRYLGPGDGIHPYAGLTLSNNTLYGAAFDGGLYNFGALFRIHTNGSDFARVVDFAGGDGGGPVELACASNVLYGITEGGGRYDAGTVFRIASDGGDYQAIKDFAWSDGSNPKGTLVVSGSTLYGTTESGGGNGVGTVFRVETNGAGFATLHHFAAAAWNGQDNTNADGFFPQAGLLLDGSTLYGTAARGGANANGAIFKLNTDGNGYEVLHTFSAGAWYGSTWTNWDGSRPVASLALSGAALYGVTPEGGVKGWGTVFKLGTDGSDYTLLREFGYDADGASPYGLMLAGTTLYGVCERGGAGQGTVFRMETDGSGFTVLKQFTGSEGDYPHARLELSGSTLYGTTSQGGCYNRGTIYQLDTHGSGFAVLKYFTGSDGEAPSGGVVLVGSSLYGATPLGGNQERGVAFRLSPGLSTIVIHPASATAPAGSTAQLRVEASGWPAPVYQWFNGTTAIDGATTSVLELSNVLHAAAGGYRVVVSNDFGAVTSMVAILSVTDPWITTQPRGATVSPGQSALFSVAGIGTEPLSYQWRKNGAPLAGSTSSTLRLEDVQLADVALYDVVVGSDFGSATSVTALLTLNLAKVDSCNPLSNVIPFSYGVNCLAAQPDGKVLAGGFFSHQLGPPEYRIYSHLVRLNADGALDTAFKEGAAPAEVRCLAVQPNGGILIGGSFGLRRLTGNGTVDTSFNPAANNNVECLAMQADGRILVGGRFTSLGGAERKCFGRLNANGTLDTAFDPAAGNADGSWVLSVVVQPDSRTLVGGSFNRMAGQWRDRIARLNPDGTLDTAFDPGANDGVTCITLQPDGKILVGGGFSTLGGQPRQYIGRLNANGALDTTFTAQANNLVTCLAMLPTGRILAGGGFSELNAQPRNCLGRLNVDGTLDAVFDPGAHWRVWSLLVQPEGRILVGGNFTTLGGEPRYYLGRLMAPEPPTVEAAPQSQTVEVGSAARFTAKPGGYPPPAYQWGFGTTGAIGGATSSKLHLAAVALDQAGAYTVVASNIAGMATSAPALLNVIVPVQRRPVPGIYLAGRAGSALNLECADTLSPAPIWQWLDTLPFTDSPQWYFDLSWPLPPQRFYRAWQSGPPTIAPALQFMSAIPALTITGAIGDRVRVDAINQVGPVDAWFALDTVTLTNPTQMYFDTTIIGQPARLYRLMPTP